MEFDKIIEIINNVVATCRDCRICDLCPYWDENNKECKVQITANVENTPDMW